MLAVRRLLWDDWNIAHIARHNVSPEEVEEVCQHDPVVDETYARRLRVVGATRAGRVLTAILAPRQDEGDYYPVTARPASSREQRIYREEVNVRDKKAA